MHLKCIKTALGLFSNMSTFRKCKFDLIICGQNAKCGQYAICSKKKIITTPGFQSAIRV